jgi:hypothetical protein
MKIRLSGFEPPTFRIATWCSVQLSYRRKKVWTARDFNPDLWTEEAPALTC